MRKDRMMTCPEDLQSLGFDLNRQSSFSFRCRVCSLCCSNKAITVGPYDILRLARNLKMTTSKFLDNYTEEGPVLRLKPDGTCLFLGPKGCAVHEDRPLVCRLYPLGQIFGPGGRERFGCLPPHPDCTAYYGLEGTVESFLNEQGAEPYLLFEKKFQELKRKPGRTLLERQGQKSGSIQDRSNQDLSAQSWIDVDATVDHYCREKSKEKPPGIDGLIDLYFLVLETFFQRR